MQSEKDKHRECLHSQVLIFFGLYGAYGDGYYRAKRCNNRAWLGKVSVPGQYRLT